MLEAAGLALMVLAPTQRNASLRRCWLRQKTDPVDAGVLAQFAGRMPFTPWQRPADEALALRACARQASRRDAAPTATRTRGSGILAATVVALAPRSPVA